MGDEGKLGLLRFVGEALYGERWQAPLAADLSVSDRTVRYWLSSATTCPEDLGPRMLAIVNRKKQIGRAHVCTPVTNAHLVCRPLLEKKKIQSLINHT